MATVAATATAMATTPRGGDRRRSATDAAAPTRLQDADEAVVQRDDARVVERAEDLRLAQAALELARVGRARDRLEAQAGGAGGGAAARAHDRRL